jgi:hypothetical protein
MQRGRRRDRPLGSGGNRSIVQRRPQVDALADRDLFPLPGDGDILSRLARVVDPDDRWTSAAVVPYRQDIRGWLDGPGSLPDQLTLVVASVLSPSGVK